MKRKENFRWMKKRPNSIQVDIVLKEVRKEKHEKENAWNWVWECRGQEL